MKEGRHMRKVEYEQHSLSKAFPQMKDSELFQLINDIRENGQREPVVIFDGQILDGWHRYQACQVAGVELKTVNLEKGVDPVSWVLSRNLHRRHLEASQRAAAVVACREWKPIGRPQENRTPGVHLNETVTNKEMAEEAHVSTTTIKNAKTAHKAGLGDKVISGEMSAKKAASTIKAPPAMLSRAICIECRKCPCVCEPETPSNEPAETITIPREEYEDIQANLSKALADNDEMGKIIDADDRLKSAIETGETWKRKYAALEARFNQQTEEFNECKRTVKSLQAVVKKLKGQIPKKEREPGEDDE